MKKTIIGITVAVMFFTVALVCGCTTQNTSDTPSNGAESNVMSETEASENDESSTCYDASLNETSKTEASPDDMSNNGFCGDNSSEVSQEQLKEIDVVSPIQEYFVWRRGNGFGYLDTQTTLGKESNVVEFQIDDLYFKPIFSGVLQVILNNEEVATLRFNVISNGSIKKGDDVTIRPYIITGSLKGYKLSDKTITAPDLGDYITKETLVGDDLINSFANYTYINGESYSEEGKQLYALYILDIKPGYTHEYPAPECSDRVFVIVLTDAENKYYRAFSLCDVYAKDETLVAGYSTRIYSHDWNNNRFKDFNDFVDELNSLYSTSYEIKRIR